MPTYKNKTKTNFIFELYTLLCDVRRIFGRVDLRRLKRFKRQLAVTCSEKIISRWCTENVSGQSAGRRNAVFMNSGKKKPDSTAYHPPRRRQIQHGRVRVQRDVPIHPPLLPTRLSPAGRRNNNPSRSPRDSRNARVSRRGRAWNVPARTACEFSGR